MVTNKPLSIWSRSKLKSYVRFHISTFKICQCGEIPRGTPTQKFAFSVNEVVFSQDLWQLNLTGRRLLGRSLARERLFRKNHFLSCYLRRM